MSEYIKKKLRSLNEDARIFENVGLKWASAISRKEAEIIKRNHC